MIGRICLLAMVFLPGVLEAFPEETPQTIVERAIEVHGGMDRLGRYQADRARLKGTLIVNGRKVPFTGETLVNLPARIKTTLKLTLDGKEQYLSQIMNGDKAQISIDGMNQRVEPKSLSEIQESMALARVVRLTPLIRDRSYELALLPETTIASRPVKGIRASVRGRKDIRLYFDKETGFLVKTEHTVEDSAGKEVLQEEYYSDFRDLKGFRRAIRMTVMKKGERIMEAEMTEVSYFEKIDDSEFGKP